MSEHDDDTPLTEDGDVAPGVMDTFEHSPSRRVQGYLLGLAFAIVLTVASFYVASSQLVWGPSIPAALITLAIAQIGVHLVFFLHLTTGPDNTNNVLALAFGVLIVALVVGGSIWIMYHLNQNLMPMGMMMQSGP